ncbi:Major Facilitator Superfamily protein [Ekhidna lutea]|uniref:Major Facilitator Superfamily protein n=1 Tax=Ekhidna lutea TaxID=447679 RepID=A0A239JDT5_EKHLU|nr:MFS transporter [Ekhidna lutea]SNT04061.1 Major Facilitator Superfamily protein [Ekhidna lutea]
MSTENTRSLKWKEVYSLAALNAAVVISWIAYHEYQPILMQNLGITHLVDFLIIAKAIILITIPPLAGWLADRIMKKNGKYMVIFTVGIGATAMVFMVVATLIGTSNIMDVSGIIPFMIVIWLISMNLFISPANSMIEAFAPAKQLPIVVGVLFLVTELLYALEPVVVGLVTFFGDTLTFVVGGILIGGTGFIFHRVSRDEVLQRKSELMQNDRVQNQSVASYLAILVVGLLLGVGKAFIVEFLPEFFDQNFAGFEISGSVISFSILGICAVGGFLISKKIADMNLQRVLITSFVVLAFGVLILIFSGNVYVTIISALIIGAAFTTMNIGGLPYAIQNLSVRHVTYGVGIYIGASEVITGLFEYLYR